ncbi:hypothetical protein Herbaro_09520 [Herbaspirillum sp. WKF16]|uniref:hypothetical protein n=1 Tax=Herbaspirillum sp. WKF16 TaxID=3028312 RepID=UPI0023A98840|nr:hypothetical protein [Herbaspirillum sp. WKF16]WDZ97999.1 hypothetical protein Herbaro_09520 [Herbaspirillum sp. WKF16]
MIAHIIAILDYVEANPLLVINLLASVLLLAHCLFRINKMDRSSNHAVRVFYILLGVGAAGVLLGPLYAYTRPQPAEVISNIGAAGLLWGGWFYRNRRASDVKERTP